MKKIGIIIIAFVSLLAVSCNPDYTNAKQLEGVWKHTKTDKDGTSTVPSEDQDLRYEFKDASKDGGTFVLTFKNQYVNTKSDGTYVISEKGTKITFSGELGGSTYSQPYELEVNSKEFIISTDVSIF